MSRGGGRDRSHKAKDFLREVRENFTCKGKKIKIIMGFSLEIVASKKRMK